MFGGTQTIAGSHSLAGVELRSATVKTLAPGTTLTVTGLLRLTDGELVGDSLDAHGDIAATSGFDGGTGILRINGSGNQLLTGTASTTVGQLPNLVIDKPGGTLSLAGTIRTQRDWTYVGGLLAPGSSSVVFGGTQTIAGSHSLAGVELRSATVKTLAPGTTLTVTGLLRLTDGELVGDSLDAHGDIAATSGFDGGTGILRINGSGNQLLTGTASTTVGQLPNLVIDKPGGTLSLAGTIRTQRDWTYVGGLLAPGSSSVVFGGTQTIAGSHSLAGVELRSATVKTLAPGTTLTVTGLLRLTDGELVGDSLDAHGDIAATSGFDGGTGILRINGSGNQLLTGTASTTVGQLPNLVIDKPGGTLSLAGTIRTQRDWTYVGGLLAPGSSTLILAGTETLTTGGAPLNRLQVRGGTATLAGALTLTSDLNIVAGTFNLDANAVDIDGALTVVGTLIADGSELHVAGNVTALGSFQAVSGRLVLDGTVAQQLTFGGSTLNDLTIDNAAGTTLAADLAVGGTLDLVTGTLSIGAHRLTIAMPIAGIANNLVAGASSSLTVAGTSAGIVVPASVTDLAELAITNPAGTALDGPLTIHAGLVLAGGNLDAGPHLLAVAAGGTVARSSGHVIGRLQKAIQAGGPVSVTFEIGDTLGYTPVQATWESVTIAGTVIVATSAGDDLAALTATGLVPEASVNRTWTLEADGLVAGLASVTVSYLASDVDPDASPMGLLAAFSTGGSSFLADVTQRTGSSLTMALPGAPDGTVSLGMPGADLAIQLTGPTSGLVGQPYSYLVTIANGGPFDASTVATEITLPAAATLVSTSQSQGSCVQSANILACDLGPIAVGASANVGLVVSFASPGLHRLAAEVTMSAAAIDSTPINDAASLDVTIGQPTPDPTPSPVPPGTGEPTPDPSPSPVPPGTGQPTPDPNPSPAPSGETGRLPDTSAPQGWMLDMVRLVALALVALVLIAFGSRLRSSTRP